MLIMKRILVLGLYVSVFAVTIKLSFGQKYSESCSNTFYQKYGFIYLDSTHILPKLPLSCTWNFTVKEGDSVLITLHDFSIEEAPRCRRGYIEILGGEGSSSKVILSKTCGLINLPTQVHSDANYISISFFSRSFSSKLTASIRTVSPTTIYKFHPDKKSWSEAREFCEQDNGELANVYPVPSKSLTDLVENNKNTVWIGQFVTPWVWLKGCVKWGQKSGIHLRYFNSKYNQKTECSVACSDLSGFLLQGGSCFCVTEHHRLRLSDQLPAEECNILCPGSMTEKCGGNNAFTFYQTDNIRADKADKFDDCLSETTTFSKYEARHCSSELGFTCGFSNGSSITYYATNPLSWAGAVSFCESTPGSVGLSELPVWPKEHVTALWTSGSRGQHSNYPQIFNTSSMPGEAYAASVDPINGYQLELADSHLKYSFICEYRISECGGNFSDTSGVLQSPGFPSGYGYNLFCEWNIMGPSGFRIRLEFSQFQLEEHELCVYDFVKVGHLRFCGKLIPRIYWSDGNNLTIIFKSDNSVSGTGFRAKWRVVKWGYEESETKAPSQGLNGAAVAGIVLASTLAIVILLVVIYFVYRARRKRGTSSALIVHNQTYDLSSASNKYFSQGNRIYINVPVGVRHPDIEEQCYAYPVRNDLDDIDERRVYDYEAIANSRLEIDAPEFCENTGSQADLIDPNREEIAKSEFHRVPKTNKEKDQNSNSDDNMTIESDLSLDEIDELGASAITLVENLETTEKEMDNSQIYAGTNNSQRNPLNAPDLGRHTQMSKETTPVTLLHKYENLNNKTQRSYQNLDILNSHTGLTAAPSHTYEIIGSENISPIPSSASDHTNISQVPSHAYAEIKDIQ